MSKFDILTKYIPIIRLDSISKRTVDIVNNGASAEPIQMPFVGYTEMVHNFIDDVYAFEERNKAMELTRYRDILKDNGLDWELEAMENADVLTLNAQAILALIMGAVRAERFSEGTLLDLFKSGRILKWLERLDDIE